MAVSFIIYFQFRNIFNIYLFMASVTEIRMLSFPCNQFNNQMPEGDGDEMLCHLKSKSAAPGAIMAKVSHLDWELNKLEQ